MKQLNDSSVIISALETYRLDPKHSLREIIRYYEPVTMDSETGKPKSAREYPNRYFVMLYNAEINDGKQMSERKNERIWRDWVDAQFIHAISPNVYRTFDEARQAFAWFDEAGNWRSIFSSYERAAITNIGSFVMYFLGKSLKKKSVITQFYTHF